MKRQSSRFKLSSFKLSTSTLIISLLALSLVLVPLSGCRQKESRIPASMLEPLLSDADVNFMAGNFVKAEEQYSRAKMIHEDTLGKDHPANADDFAKIAACQEAQGNVASALNNYQNAISIYQKQGDQLVSEMASAYSALGLLQKKENKPEEAEKNLNMALSLREKAPDKHTSDVMVDVENLVNFYQSQKNQTPEMKSKLAPLQTRLAALKKQVEQEDKEAQKNASGATDNHGLPPDSDGSDLPVPADAPRGEQP
jgi:tetratricopeptide (TPR) repeat protein